MFFRNPARPAERLDRVRRAARLSRSLWEARSEMFETIAISASGPPFRRNAFPRGEHLQSAMNLVSGSGAKNRPPRARKD